MLHKVHGIKSLRVADLSICPEIISGNTNAPAIMIGEKASDIIIQDTLLADHNSSLVHSPPHHQAHL